MLIAFENHIANTLGCSATPTGYLHDVHSFPSISALRYTKKIRHISSDAQLYTMNLIVRGFVYSSVEESLYDSDELARQIEEAVISFPHSYLTEIAITNKLLETQDARLLTTLQLYNIIVQNVPARRYGGRLVTDARVLTVETDEGLFTPAGLCELGVEIEYDYTNNREGIVVS